MEKIFAFLLAAFLCNVARADIKLAPPTVSLGEYALEVTLALTDQNGMQLDASKLFFCVYTDGAAEPYVFAKSAFQYIEADMTEVPYGYSDSQSYDIWSSEGTTGIYPPSDFTQRMGAQAIYHDGDVTYTSAIAWSDGTVSGGEGEGSGEGGSEGEGGGEPSQTVDESLLISNPEGTMVKTVRACTVFYKLGQATIYSGADTGTATNYVKGTDGNLYLSCFMGGNDTKNYLKLEPTTTQGQYVAKMPQLVMVEEYEGVKYGYYANRMVKEHIAENPDSINYLYDKDAANELKFALADDGTLTLMEENLETILGLTYADSIWTGFGDGFITETPTEDKMVKRPEGAELMKFVFSYEWGNWPEFGRMEKFINGAIVGNELYLNSPYIDDPDQWFKGTIADGKVTFKCGQMMGIDPEFGRYLYLRGGNMQKKDDGYYYYTDAEELVFDWDEEKQGFAKNTNLSIYVSRGYGQRGYNTNYDFASAELYVENVADLLPPSWYSFCEKGTFDDYGYSYAQVSIPTVDSEGNKLNTDNLYYSIYIGDANTPFVFAADTYTNDLTEDMTEIPFNMNGIDFYPYSPGSEIHAFFTYFSIDDLKMGVQTVYYDSKGERHTSEIVYNQTEGIRNIEQNAHQTPNIYYNLQGQRLSGPRKGIVICNGKKILVK